MQLKPRSQRDMSVDQLIRYFNRKLAGIPGIQVFLQNPPPIQIGGRRTKSCTSSRSRAPTPRCTTIRRASSRSSRSCRT